MLMSICIKVRTLIDLEKLEELATEASLPFEVRRVSSALAAAITDWPTYNLDSVEPFMLALKEELGELSRTNLHDKMKNLSVQTDAWKIASLSELLEAWGGADEHVHSMR